MNKVNINYTNCMLGQLPCASFSLKLTDKPKETSKTFENELVYLTKPLTIIKQPSPKVKAAKIPGSLPEIPIPLVTRPLQKLDRWTKKNEKNDARDIDVELSKVRSKKKIKPKVNFEEDLDSVKELIDQPLININDFSLSTARPPKPNPVNLAMYPNKQKIYSKKNSQSTSQSYKKELAPIIREKPTKLTFSQNTTIETFSDASLIPKTEIIKTLFLKNIKITLNQNLDLTTIKKLGEEFGIEIEIDNFNESEVQSSLKLRSQSDENLESRPPIVTIIGHVNHGKTTLLDRIQKTQIAQKEEGGMTQKIGVYEIQFQYKNEIKKIVFLDTPGHDAFSQMRTRSISISDIIILVVAADEGIPTQVTDVIKYCQSKNIPILVTINKIDKKESDVETIKKELASQGLVPEEWGGETITIPISAMLGTNIDTLLEMICVLSDTLKLQANPKIPAKGLILDSKMNKTLGPMASVIVQDGTLRVGNVIVLDKNLSKIRGITNCRKENIQEAPPSSPVLIWGLPKVPSVGDTFFSFQSQKEAKIFIHSKDSFITEHTSYQQFANRNRHLNYDNDKKQIQCIIKTDTKGSAESIINTLTKSNSQIQILNCSPGEVTETDVTLAYRTKSILIAFNTNLTLGAQKECKATKITLKEFNIIYNLLNYIESINDTLSKPIQLETPIGSGIVKTIFPFSKSFVAGTSIIEGKITSSSWIHVLRKDHIIYKGFITSLKKLKDDAKEINQGEDCGIFVKNFHDWATDDIIKSFELSKKNEKEEEETHFFKK